MLHPAHQFHNRLPASAELCSRLAGTTADVEHAVATGLVHKTREGTDERPVEGSGCEVVGKGPGVLGGDHVVLLVHPHHGRQFASQDWDSAPPATNVRSAPGKVPRVSTLTNHAAHLRGGLVGVCSALTAAVAHTAAGGVPPSGSPLVFLLIACATLGAAVGGISPQTRSAATALLIVGLGSGQALGHLTLAMTGGHHHGDAMVSAPMLALHGAAAIGLGLLIGAVEYLYIVCATVLSWLRLFAVGRIKPAGDVAWWPSDDVVARPVLLRAGLGMRAPPRALSAGV